MHGEPHQRRSRLTVQGEQLRNHGSLGRVERNAARVARPVGARPIAVRGIGPRQQPAGAQLGEPATPHALGNQGALVLGHRATDLQQQMIVRVVAHRPVKELGGATGLRPLLHEHHLVHVITREAVGGSDQHAVDLATLYGIAQAVQPRSRQHGAAIAVVAKHMGRIDDPAIGGTGVHRGGQPLELLLNGLVVDLMAGRDTAVDRYAHDTPPAGSGTPAHRAAPVGSSPTAEGAGRPGPIAAGRLVSARQCAGCARCVAAAVACSPPQRVISLGSWDAAAARSLPRARGQLN
jgi:hypothetical protein